MTPTIYGGAAIARWLEADPLLAREIKANIAPDKLISLLGLEGAKQDLSGVEWDQLERPTQLRLLTEISETDLRDALCRKPN